MIALAVALTALSVLLASGCILCGKWLHDANSSIGNLRDTMTAADAVSDAYKYERDQAVVELAVAKDLLSREQTLRAIAEAQRNEAQRKARDLLRKHMRTATDEEIRETVRDLFETPLSVVPRLSGNAGGVSGAAVAGGGVRSVDGPRRSDAGPDALLDPDA